ncbi:MAG: ATP-binding protein [Massilibacteroides sp.]|nr:ATP-binding protein [Massilibacteroides sp.]MDD3061254.1 ATP-binding protein [Massilibacteroides sp.]MDD4115445.1 ATP-binding protein [Massilibacteroides sp.]MDD4659753.1 ATP-binding protein [Massilibacteroides sp.]
MRRTALSFLQKWKQKNTRKPLIIRGARQVGKTWLMKEFAKTEYENFAYINFEDNQQLKTLFLNDFDIPRILLAIQIATGIKPEPNKTLIIFDEIQEAERALTSLKYFRENAPEYHVVAAGSLLGIALHENTSFPVGKVEFLDLYPLSFTEFLEALGEHDLIDLIQKQQWEMINTFKTKYIELLKQYYYVGGMPEVVSNYVINQDFSEVRQIQQQILNSYEQDFSKHAPTDVVPRIRMVWNSVPAQLSKENRKFIYGLIKQGARAKEFELALAWLMDCGLIHKINRVSKPALPLKAYEDMGAFKLYLLDIGLLGAMANLDVKTLLDGNLIFTEFKGALTEQYVLQQLVTDAEISIFYWSSEKSDGEIDLLIQYKNEIVPIEVKAAENLQAKSLRAFVQKNKSKMAIRTSMSDFREETWLTNMPLYAINELTDYLELKS